MFLYSAGPLVFVVVAVVASSFLPPPQAAEFVMDLGPPVTTSIALHHFTAWANYEEVLFTFFTA